MTSLRVLALRVAGAAGQLWLGEIGACSCKNRICNPGLGRFIQPDPIGLAGGLNLYAYVGGDPINFVDPWGVSPDIPEREPHQEYKDKECPFSMHCRDDHLLQWIASGDALIFFSASMGMSPSQAAFATAIMQLRTIYGIVGEPHFFAESAVGLCSADLAFHMIRLPLMPAPGAAFAEEGGHERKLWGNNPIFQIVDPDNRTLINITQPGHRYYPGFLNSM
ncbi:RHS repeat-associated core domain-containing protein [Alkalicaulis satelles]|uniref:RHS repeat-associated core domain-containing protein n=1 Tax=Alkalicaulis satelles TaxID=2609175 RepID=A0A5M6ZMY7_9PROT|nr:RHS repeat-associated core domain-containing protein [Alkalicaulis satelles]KAA5805057.1 RHS repeat-associated core domain-containing protein [Alkalicaulis satelles]